MSDSPLESPPVPLADSLFNRLLAFGKESARRGEAYMADSSGAVANPGDIAWREQFNNRWTLGIPRADGVWNVTHPVGVCSFLSAQEVENALTGWDGWHLDRAPVGRNAEIADAVRQSAKSGVPMSEEAVKKHMEEACAALRGLGVDASFHRITPESDARAAAFKALVNLLNDTSADVTARAAELILQHTAP